MTDQTFRLRTLTILGSAILALMGPGCAVYEDTAGGSDISGGGGGGNGGGSGAGSSATNGGSSGKGGGSGAGGSARDGGSSGKGSAGGDGGIGGSSGRGGSGGAGGTDGSSGSGGSSGAGGTQVDAGIDERPVVCPAGVEGTGRGLKGEYFDHQDLTSLKATRVDPSVDFEWGRAPDVGIPQVHFSVRWTGQVQPRFSGTHTFYTNSDDGIRLWVDGKELIDHWSEHGSAEDSNLINLVGGQKYDIKVEYYNGLGGASARLSWSSDCQLREVVPPSQLYFQAPACPAASIGTGTGVRGDYYDNQDLTTFKVSRTDPAIDFDWGGGKSPDPSVEPTTYSVRWTGQVQAKYSEFITFYTTSDDGVRLAIDDKLLIDNWTEHGRQEYAATVLVVAGQKYNLHMEHFNAGGGATAKLSWGSLCQAKETIPKTQLFSTYTGSDAGLAPADAGSDASLSHADGGSE